MKNIIQKLFKKQQNKSFDHTFKVVGADGYGNEINIINFFKNWSFACVSRRADSFAAINNYPATQLIDGSIEYLSEAHWINKLLTEPNKIYNLSWYQIKQLAQKWLDFSGNVFLYLPKNGTDRPQQIWVLPSNKVDPIIENNELVAYKYYTKTGYEIYQANEICHLKTLAPTDDPATTFYLGTPELMHAAADAIGSDTSVRNFLKEYFMRELLPPLFLKVNRMMTDDEFQRFKLRFKDALPDKSLITVLEGGAEIEHLSSTNLGAGSSAFNSLFDDINNAKTICGIFGIPYDMVDTSTRQSYASAYVNLSSFEKYTLEPLIIKFEDALGIHFSQYEENILFTHNEIKWTDPEFELRKWQMQVQLGLVTVNEYRRENGFEEIEGGDVPYTQFLYGAMAGEGMTAGDEDEPALENFNLNLPKIENDKKEINIKRRDYSKLNELEKSVEWVRKDYLVNLEYKSLTNNIKNTFVALEKEIVKNINKSIEKNNTELFDVKVWQTKLQNNCKKNLIAIINNMFIDASYNLDLSNLDKNIVILKTITAINKKLNISVATIKSELNKIINQLIISDGLVTPTKLTQQVKNNFKGYKTERARTIARTVSTATAGHTQNIIAEATNSKLAWISQRDGAVRDTHAITDGHLQDKNGFFHVGMDKMEYPGGGSIAEENINCRCYSYYQ